jgi:hypothetical protein
VGGAGEKVTSLPPSHNAQRAVAAAAVEVGDVGAECLADPQPVHRQQRDQLVVSSCAESGLDG